MLVQDSIATPSPAPAVSRIHDILAAGVPNVWVMVGLTVGLVILITYMLRVPHDYPFRGAIVAFASMGFLVCAVITGMKVWDTMPHQLPDVRSGIKSIERHAADKEPVGPLETYVQRMPGGDTLSRHEQPSVGGLPGGTIWDETTSQPIADVIRYYSDDANHAGWQVEFSGASMIVLRRTVTSTSQQLENERMRIQARPNPDHQSARRTEIEFELTRRLK